MRIATLSLNNYRHYQNCKIDFTRPTAKGFDLNVFVGLNGAGKTNVANSICWCLWEIEPDLALQGKNTGKGMLNDRSRERLKQIGKDYGPVKVEMMITLDDLGAEKLHISRSQECSVDGGIDKPSQLVFEHIRPDPDHGTKIETLEGEEARLEIESYIPRDISSYLVFDGEQLTGYFRSDRAAKVKTAMLALSGVGKLNVAIEHHEKQLAEIDKGVSNHSHEVADCEEVRKQAQKEYELNEQSIEKLTEQVGLLTESIEQLQEFIGSHKDVPQLIETKKRLEAQREDLQRRQHRVREDKCELVRTYYPVLAVFPAAMKLRAFISNKREKDELPPPLKREFFEQILKVGKCTVCGEALTENAVKEIKRQLALYDKKIMATDTSSQLTKLLEPEILAIIERVRLYQGARDRVLADEAALAAMEEQIDSDYQAVAQQLAQVNDTKAYQEAISKLNAQSAARQSAVDQLGYCKVRKPELDKKLSAANLAYEQAYRANAGNDELMRKHQILERSVRIIRKTKDLMIEEIRRSIENRINSFWQVLTWKSNEDIGEVTVDEGFRIQLYHNGLPALGSLSAAERALLALSVTLALHSQAGINFPFVIDTPVANMSLEHRKNFATVLKNLSKGKQITMLFTDTEFVADIPKVFGKDINMLKKIEFKSGITTVV